MTPVSREEVLNDPYFPLLSLDDPFNIMEVIRDSHGWYHDLVGNSTIDETIRMILNHDYWPHCSSASAPRIYGKLFGVDCPRVVAANIVMTGWCSNYLRPYYSRKLILSKEIGLVPQVVLTTSPMLEYAAA